MKVLFDDTKKILGVFADDAVGIEGAYSISLPSVLKTKLNKTVTTVRQKRDASGNPLFVAEGKETTQAVSNFTLNPPATDQFPYTRSISLLDSPSEWTVEDVLNAKYQEMAGKANYWYNEFLDTAAIDLGNSKVSTGVFGISIPQGGAVEFVPLKLVKAVNSLEFYLEADAATIVKASADGGEFVEATPKPFGNRLAVSFAEATDNVVVRIENPEDSGADAPVHALAIFY